MKAIGYATKHSFSRLKPMEFERDEARDGEVEIEVLFCGICHSDIHQARNDWGNTVYPCMPGHEIVGRIRRTGPNATRHAVGDLVGVGCMIDSCRACEPCTSGEQNYCQGPNSWLATYNGPMKPAAMSPTGDNSYGRDNTFGGYSSVVVVPEDFVLRIPKGYAPQAAAPILCAGVTTFSPLRHWKVGQGSQVGVLGFGGLGDMAAKLARAMGAEVTILTRSLEKFDEARRLGATPVQTSDREAISKLASRFDFILSTIPESHDLNPFVPLLKRDGTICVVGALDKLAKIDNQALAMQRKTIAASIIGSLAETQEVLDFCAKHSIAPDIEVIPIQQVNDAYKRVENGEVRFRYVIDMASLADEQRAA